MSDPLQPHFFSADVPRFLSFWTDALGFRLSARWPEEGAAAWAELQHGSQGVMVGAVPPAGSEQDGPVWQEVRPRLGRPGAMTTYLRVEDVDEHHRKAAAAGAPVLQPPTDTWYGLREWVTKDPDGNLVSVYRPRAD